MACEAWRHGDHAGGFEDLFFKFLFDALLLSLFNDLLALFFGDETRVDADAEFDDVDRTAAVLALHV